MIAGTSLMEATQPATAPSVRKTVASAPLEFCSANVVRREASTTSEATAAAGLG